MGFGLFSNKLALPPKIYAKSFSYKIAKSYNRSGEVRSKVWSRKL